LPIYLFVRAALVIFAYAMSFVPPGWLKRGRMSALALSLWRERKPVLLRQVKLLLH
jgi:hypothetical protein